MSMHATKLRWLAWLRVKMLVRGFARRPVTLVLAIIGIIVLLAFAGEIGFVLLLAYRLSAPANMEVLYLVLTAVMLFWIVLPLLSYSTNEGLDVTKLQLFPLTRLEIMFSLLFSSLFDVWIVFLLAVFGVTIASWWMQSFALGLLTLLVIVVFYIVMVGISQLVLALLMRTLQSRRFRDLSIIILALFGSSCYFLQRFAIAGNNILNLGSTLQNGGFSPYLQWLPSGVAASAIRAATQGNWSLSFGFLGALVVIGAVVLYLWQLVLERSMTASETGGSRRVKQRQENAPVVPVAAAPAAAVAARSGESRSGGLLDLLQVGWPAQLIALTRKELVYFWREPLLKVRIFQMAFYLAIFVFAPGLGITGREGGFTNSYTAFTSVAVVLLLMVTLSLNTLGMERQSLITLFIFPLDRRRLLWGKNLAVFLLGFGSLLLLMIVCATLFHQQTTVLPAAVIGLAGMGVALGGGNLASAYFPRYQRAMGQRGVTATGGQQPAGGCLSQIMALVMLVVTVLLLTPVALGVGIPMFMSMQWLWVVTMPFSLVYGVVLYVVLTNVSARRIQEREPEILALTTRE